MLTTSVVSVYDPQRELYDYYRLPRGVRLVETRARAHPVMGSALVMLLPRLPAGAVKIGSGKLAMGRIAVRGERWDG
jgi:hypothetical protein